MSDVKEKIEMELKPFEPVCDMLLETLKEMTMGNTEATPEDVAYISKSLGEVVDVKKDIVEMCYKKQIMEAMEESDYGEDYDEDGPMYYTPARSKTSGRYMRRGDGRRNYPSTVVYYTDNGSGNSDGRRGENINGNMGGRMNYEPDMPMYRMDMDLYKMRPEELRKRDMQKGVHYYTEPYTGIGNDKVIGDRMTPVNIQDGTNSRASDWSEMNQSKIDRAIKKYTENKDMQSLDEMITEIEHEIKNQASGMDATQKNMTKSKLTNLVNSIR